ncbi:hypothetical protein LWI29_033830 [Acer saccharum]|uniref:C-JID domain-containing protein n=1 Tax=Acer saccharum TaxID=4024 RepID=A0AA39RRZ7_ACESA|nr:hypothetical protein LWI29_033830 [Acer saccharum]
MYNLRTLIINCRGVHFHNGGLAFLPDELRYLHWGRYPLEVLPSSFNPENLVELDLFYSKIKQLWEGSTRVPKLKWLKLDYCVNLISIPDLSNFPSAEIINLKNCHSLIEIHSSRECPKNLHSLNLSFCRNLSSFPSNIHLSEEPSFSTSVVLHSSREDSEFSLRYCFSLTKFPDIPRNIKRLDLSGSLEFNFMNCLKLNQKTVSNLLIFFQVSVQKLQLMGTEKIISLFKVSPHEVKGSLCLPGSKIPEWFCYKNLGSSIHTNIPVLRNDCGRSSYIMGFAICLVIGFEDYNFDSFKRGFDVRYDFHIETSDGHKEQFFGNSIQLSGMPVHRSNHIILGYNLSRKFYEFFQELDTRLVNRGMSDYVGTLVVFNIRSIHFVEGKYCGIQPIYVQAQVMNSVAINQDTGDINGYNDTVEETCEPHPKRTCTKANQCFTTHGL